MTDPFTGLAPANIEAIVPYEPGKPVEELERELGVRDAIKLASNENPIGPSPLAVAAAQAALPGVNRYPDGAAFRLRAALAEHAGVSQSHIIVGSGSSELIDLAVRVFCRPGEDEVVTHRYAFFSYKLVSQAHGVVFREVEVAPDLSVDVAALSAAIGARTKLVFLPNPNNPTGGHLERSALERFVERLPARVLLVVDEAYFEYADGAPGYASALAFRERHPLLLVLRTFSKIYGLAALRVGYGIADPHVVGYLDRVRPVFNVSTIGQEAALGDTAHVERSRRVNADGLAQLAAGLAALPVRVVPSVANFILVDLGRDAAPIYDRLLRQGVIVRPLRQQGLLQHVRVSIGTRAENERFLAAIHEIFGA
jgi:histidinol-phosphate aminotransferase